MKILYYDCFSGISGDMNLSAMIDLGIPVDYLKGELSRLNLSNYEIIVSEGARGGIRGTRVQIAIDAQASEQRGLNDILAIINRSPLGENIRTRSEKMFVTLAGAEAKVHGISVEEVHFHEVGAVDAILDIVGAAVCLDYLRPDRIISSPVELGSGLTRCTHGTFPVPAPAACEILRNIPVKRGNQPFEATTPTGAAILACNVDEFTECAAFTIRKTGYGIGSMESEIPDVLRVHLGEVAGDHEGGCRWVIECNIDDMSPELLGYVMDRLFAEGADDVYLTPIIMKKSRSASQLSVLCASGKKEALISVVLRETSSFGLRSYEVEKRALPREFATVETSHGTVTVKKALFPDGEKKVKLEYDEIALIARKQNRPIGKVYAEIMREVAGRDIGL